MEYGVDTVREKLQKLGHLDLAKVMGGAFSRNLMRGFLMILIAGFLAPQALGILRAIYSFFKIAASLAEFGLDYAMVTLVAAAFRGGKAHEKDQILKTVLFLKISVILGVLLVSGFLIFENLYAQRISLWVLGDTRLALFIRLALFAVCGQLIWKYISSYLAAHREFGRLAFFTATTPLLMLVTTLILIILNWFNLLAGIFIYLFAPTVTALLWWSLLSRKFMRYPAWNKYWVSRIIKFSRWIYLSGVASNTRTYANTLLLKNPRLSGSTAAGEANAGLYSFGNDLANQIALFSESLFTVLLPKASGKTDIHQLKRFVKRSYKNLIILMIPLALLIFLAKPMIYVLAYFKASYLEYLPSIPVFMILYSGALFSVASIPIRTVLYALEIPQVESYIEIGMVFLLIVGAIILIPRYGCIGAAITVFVQRLLSFVIIISYGLAKLKKRI